VICLAPLPLPWRRILSRAGWPNSAYGRHSNHITGDTQKDLPTAQQSLAAEGLARLARRRPLDLTKIEQLTIQIQSDGAALSTDIPTHAVLSNVATAQSLPERSLDYLFSRLDRSEGQFDFNPLTAARLLACNAHFLDDRRKATIKEWLDKHTTENRTMSSIHKALGCAALEWPLEAGELAVLVGRLSPASRFPPRLTNYRGETVISATGDEAAVALGKVAQKYTLDPGLIGRLASIAAARIDLESRSEILLGLAQQWYGDRPKPASIYRRLAASQSDAIQRQLEMQVAIALLKHNFISDRQATTAELMRRWQDEPEPELRIALARILGVTYAASGAEP